MSGKLIFTSGLARTGKNTKGNGQSESPVGRLDARNKSLGMLDSLYGAEAVDAFLLQAADLKVSLTNDGAESMGLTANASSGFTDFTMADEEPRLLLVQSADSEYEPFTV